MEFTVDGLFIAIVAILPGFFVGYTRSVVLNDRPELEIEERVATGIIFSIVLNAVVAIPFALWVLRIKVDQNSDVVIKQLQEAHVSVQIWYVVALYASAFLVGLVLALNERLNLSALAYRWRLTPISPNPNVFSDVLDATFATPENRRLSGLPIQAVPWLRIEREGIVVVGRLTQSSVRFETDKPIEIFLSPAYIFRHAQQRRIDADRDGVHMRVLPTDVVEILTAWDMWKPDESILRPD